jgi:hypothetical protein
MAELDHDAQIAKLFDSLDPKTLRFSARESTTVEFKQSFNWASRSLYAKSMAAFSNNRGGYLIFGVANAPRVLVGVQGSNFDNLDEAVVTAYLNSTFAPAIEYDKFAMEIAGHKICVFYVAPHPEGPVVSLKADNDIREAEIYYRYNARNDKIRYPELKAVFERIRERERRDWMALFSRVGKVGPSNTAVMDVVGGTIEGSAGNLLIDAQLLPKLKFIKEGQLAPKGRPVLKLVGDVRPVSVAGYGRARRALRITDNPSAPEVREESVLQNYPMDYQALVRTLRRRYSDFKQDQRFINLRNSLRGNLKFCKMRLLDPAKPRSSRKEFYSEAIVGEFDKHYTRNKVSGGQTSAKQTRWKIT